MVILRKYNNPAEAYFDSELLTKAGIACRVTGDAERVWGYAVAQAKRYEAAVAVGQEYEEQARRLLEEHGAAIGEPQEAPKELTPIRRVGAACLWVVLWFFGL